MSVCLCVVHTAEICENGGTDPDAVLRLTHVGPYPSIRGALLWGDMVTHVGPYPSIKGARLRGDVVTHMSISVHKRGTFAGNRRHLKFGMWFVSDS